MSRRASKNLSLNSSDDDEKESIHSSKVRSKRNSSSSSSERPPHSNRPKSAEKKINSRSSSRTKKSSDETSSEESAKTRPVSRPQSNLRVKKQDSDSDSASDSTVKKSHKSSNESFDRPRNSRTSDRKRQILRSSSSSRSRSNSPAYSEKKPDSDSDVESTTLGSSILKIKIESKPPIDKDRHNRKASSRQSYFEKPDSDSESDSKISSYRSKNSKKKSHADDTDSQDSCNDMTDVSSLPSPKETKNNFRSDKYDEEMSVPRGRSAFYSALHQKSHTRPNSVNFNFTQNYTKSTDFSEKTYGRELMRIEAQQRRMFNEFLKENGGKSRMVERPLRLTSSAINRQRDQQRIEKENQLILKRLLTVKSSKEVRRDNQLKDYEKNMGISDLNLSRSSVKSVLSTKRSQKSSVANSRVSSAKSNRGQTPFEYSNRTFSLSRKPEWNSRW